MSRWSGVAATLGGITWALLAAGWTFSHGSTQSPRGDDVLGLGAHEFTRLLAVPAALWFVSLIGDRPDARLDRRAAARAGWAMALVGAALVAVGAILQTSVVDPSLDFDHPAVQGGWLLFIAGLLPFLTLGMLLSGFATSPASPVRWLRMLVGSLSPLPVLAFFLSGVSSGGVGWDVALAAMHAAPGLGWIALGVRGTALVPR